MSETMNERPQMVEGVMVVTRFFVAPREAVWKAWTEAERFQRWFMPRGFSMPHCTLDARVGGSVHFLHRNGDGEETWVKGVFLELVPPERFEWELFFSDEKGKLVARPGFPRQSKVTVTLEERPGGTLVTVRHADLLRDQGEGQGWTESLDHLAEELASGQTLFSIDPNRPVVVASRIFDAPRELVWKAHVDPTQIPRWWGPRRMTTVVETMDVEPGGHWRYIHTDADGTEHAFNGTYREVDPPKRLVSTFEYEGTPGHVLVQTTELEEIDERRTKLTLTSVYDSFEDRKGMVDAGMEGGLRESMDRLAELVAAQPEGGSR